MRYLRDTYGLDVKLIYSGTRKKSVLVFSTSASEKFQKLVAPYVHPSMEYKLLPRFRGQVQRVSRNLFPRAHGIVPGP